MDLVSDYPLWFAPLCLLLGAGYAFVYYYRARNQDFPHVVTWSLATFRFVAVALISFLLFSPLIRRSKTTVEKPVIIFGVDNSASLVYSADSAFYRGKFPTLVDAFVKLVGQKYEVRTYAFGDKVRSGFPGSYNDLQTDISGFLGQMENIYTNRNVGALVIASDGIYNSGSDPYYGLRRFNFPVYTVAMGDTAVQRDVIIRKVLNNKAAFIGDKSPVEVLLELNRCAGEQSRLRVMHDKKEVFSATVNGSDQRSIRRIGFMVEAKSPGLKRYSVEVEPLDGEINLKNNRQDFFIEVNDKRQRIALLYETPHPDISAIQQAVSPSARFDLALYKAAEFRDQPDQFDLVILYQVPSIAAVTDLSRVIASKTSLLFLLGTQSDMNAFNSLQSGLSVSSGVRDFVEIQPVYNGNFSRFSVGKEEMDLYHEFPPLLSPFGVYNTSPLSDILFYQKQGSIPSRSPLIMFSRMGERKTGIITGENIWRWRVAAYRQNESHTDFDQLIDRIVQYLSVKEDRSFFRIQMPSKFNENEDVEVVAEVFNPSYEMVNDQDVNLTINDEEGNSYPYVFSKYQKSYFLRAGQFPPGNYTYAATTMQGTTAHKKSGSFAIVPVNKEAVNLVADHALLLRMATSHNGEMIPARDLEQLAKRLVNREGIKSVSYTTKTLSDLIGTPWLFLAILLLLTLEWVLRRRYGTL